MVDSVVLKGLINGGWKDLPFEPFKPGIEAHFLLRGEPEIAILKYAPGASAPLHLHQAAESILMLEGSQSDARGTYVAGDYVINMEDSQHSVSSPEGCVALLQWAKPVRFLA